MHSLWLLVCRLVRARAPSTVRNHSGRLLFRCFCSTPSPRIMQTGRTKSTQRFRQNPPLPPHPPSPFSGFWARQSRVGGQTRRCLARPVSRPQHWSAFQNMSVSDSSRLVRLCSAAEGGRALGSRVEAGGESAQKEPQHRTENEGGRSQDPQTRHSWNAWEVPGPGVGSKNSSGQHCV